jgi:hypothetical protein
MPVPKSPSKMPRKIRHASSPAKLTATVCNRLATAQPQTLNAIHYGAEVQINMLIRRNEAVGCGYEMDEERR